jgi:predicted aminopeptidase
VQCVSCQVYVLHKDINRIAKLWNVIYYFRINISKITFCFNAQNLINFEI